MRINLMYHLAYSVLLPVVCSGMYFWRHTVLGRPRPYLKGTIGRLYKTGGIGAEIQREVEITIPDFLRLAMEGELWEDLTEKPFADWLTKDIPEPLPCGHDLNEYGHCRICGPDTDACLRVFNLPCGHDLNEYGHWCLVCHTTPGTGEKTYISHAVVDPVSQSGTIKPTWSIPYEAGLCDPDTDAVLLVFKKDGTVQEDRQPKMLENGTLGSDKLGLAFDAPSGYRIGKAELEDYANAPYCDSEDCDGPALFKLVESKTGTDLNEQYCYGCAMDLGHGLPDGTDMVMFREERQVSRVI